MTADEAAKTPGTRTALYRHFDGDGRLLYVGISLAPFRRLSSHRHASHWSESIRNIAVEWFPDRAQALSAEFAAITTEKPLHNIEFNGPAVFYSAKDPELAKALRRRKPTSTEDMRHALSCVGRKTPKEMQ